MLCYAWDVLEITDDIKIAEDDYDDAYNLLSRVFSFGIGRLIRSGFYRSYVEKTEELTALRGRIRIKDSINSMSMIRKKLVCSYDEYSANVTFNQILKYTLDSLIKSNQVDKRTKGILKKQVLYFEGIDPIAPKKDVVQKLIYNKNNAIYKMLINVAVMLYENVAINEDEGELVFKDFYRKEHMEKVFEHFILNFYKKHLDKKIYKVHAPKIRWQMDKSIGSLWGDLFDVDFNPVDRRTDIVIENKSINLQIIFDAKYYRNAFVKAYMNEEEERIRAAHLNQIRGYLIDSNFKGEKFGALLYPMVDLNLSQGTLYPIQGTPIGVKTIDLNKDWKDIEDDLLYYLEKIEKPLKDKISNSKVVTI